jgi:signal transduction histidine kinase
MVRQCGLFTSPVSSSIMIARGTSLTASPFFARLTVVKVLHLAILGVTYGMAAAFYGAVSAGAGTNVYFPATYFGCIAASAAASVLALFLRPGLWLYVVLFLRTYLIIVFGYSIGAFLSSRLVLGVGLMTEIGVLAPFPFGLIVGVCALAALALAQTLPALFGSNGLVDALASTTLDQLAAYCFVLAATAVAASLLARMSVRRQEQDDLLRIQEANLDTLAELNLNLQGYARTVDEESSERERNRISREIHDISGYIFTNLIALMDAAGSMPRDDQAGLTDTLITARKTAQEGLRETRFALRRLRNEQLRENNVPRAIFKIVSIFRKITGLDVMLSLGNLPNSLDHELSLALYRSVQEALTNAVRHGKASRVRVIFWVEGEELRLTITDNGKGAFEVVKGIGLAGMEERLGALGGSVQVGQAPEGGFSLTVQVPLKAVGDTL